MKLLQINCVYKKGSTGKLAYYIHNYMLDNDEQSVICYGRGEKTKDENVVKSCGEIYSKLNHLLSRFTGFMYGGCYFSTKKLIKIIKAQNPHVVHLQCINGYFVNVYKLIEFLKKSRIKTVLTLHAEFMYTANCSHSFDCEKWKNGCKGCTAYKAETESLIFNKTEKSFEKMKKAFEGFENLTVVSVSPWLMKRAASSPILQGKNHLTVLNGVDTNIFRPYDTTKLKKELGLENKKIVFHATAWFSNDKNHLKGGGYVTEMAERFLKEDKNVIFLVAGEHSPLGDMPKNVIVLGNVTDQNELAEFYSLADVTLLTSKRETFSMVVAESLCVGTPVVGFEAGAPEEITINEFSSFVPYGDEDELFNKLKYYLNSYQKDQKIISETAKLKYDKDIMVKEYYRIYKQLNQ